MSFIQSYWEAILNFSTITVCSICETVQVKKKIRNDESVEVCKQCHINYQGSLCKKPKILY